MEPIAVVTAVLGAMYIVARGPLLVRPVETVAVYRRMFGTPKRMRLFGALLGLFAAILVTTAIRAGAVDNGLDILIQIVGWIAALRGSGAAVAELF